ncbi:hypothetical protein BU15DRAFT_68579 [Melanogaster broomeanus]|nr:hypothetical protein BU15DRAFT_68579 [Melanogaster broomeanus]
MCGDTSPGDTRFSISIPPPHCPLTKLQALFLDREVVLGYPNISSVKLDFAVSAGYLSIQGSTKGIINSYTDMPKTIHLSPEARQCAATKRWLLKPGVHEKQNAKARERMAKTPQANTPPPCSKEQNPQHVGVTVPADSSPSVESIEKSIEMWHMHWGAEDRWGTEFENMKISVAQRGQTSPEAFLRGLKDHIAEGRSILGDLKKLLRSPYREQGNGGGASVLIAKIHDLVLFVALQVKFLEVELDHMDI